MEDSDFLCNLNMSFFQHAKMFGSVSTYFSCVVSTGRDLTLPIKSSSAKKKIKERKKAAVLWKCSHSAHPSPSPDRSSSQHLPLSARCASVLIIALFIMLV